ncbi:MAG: hypothetical protein R6U96_17560 [Promethearchaeia archaeon]
MINYERIRRVYTNTGQEYNCKLMVHEEPFEKKNNRTVKIVYITERGLLHSIIYLPIGK